MRDVLYKLFETNADLEDVKLIHSGIVLDIAETLLVKHFIDSEHNKDFILYNYSDNTILGACFSAKTNQLRNECQG